MKLVRQLAACTLAVYIGSAALAADGTITGKWVGDVTLGSGQVVPFVAHLTQQRTAVNGKLDGINGGPSVEVKDGHIAGDKIRFSGTRKVNDAEVSFNYTGVLSGDSIDFTIVRADGKGNPVHVATKRVAE